MDWNPPFENMSDDAVKGYMLGINKAFYVVSQVDKKGTNKTIDKALGSLHDLHLGLLKYMESHPERKLR